jgi:hypothetical protein
MAKLRVTDLGVRVAVQLEPEVQGILVPGLAGHVIR